MKRIFCNLLSLLLILTFIPNHIASANSDEPAKRQGIHSTVNDSVYNAVYDFSVTLGTLPTLYAGLNAFSSNNETYMWYVRKGTFDSTKMPEHVNMILPESYYGKELVDAIGDKILDIYNTNQNAAFNLYVDDLRVHLILQLFVANQIPESNFNIYLLSDGTGSYTTFRNLFGNGDAYFNWEYHSNNYEETSNRIQLGEQNVIPYDNDMSMYQSMYYASQKNNVEYWLQFPELLKSNDSNITDELMNMNTVKRLPYEMYGTLSDEKKHAFLNAVGVDKEKFDELFNSSDKPNLIISGTSFWGENNNFEHIVEQIVDDYSTTYDLFFKPHPAWDPETNSELIKLNRKQFLESNGVTILPAQLPMEALLWAYPDVKIGGYSSTLYMSTDREQTIFFIADNKESLVAPLPDLYDVGHFGKAKFYKVAPVQEPKPELKDSNATISEIKVTADNTVIPLTVNDSVYSATVANDIDHVTLHVNPTSAKSTITMERDGNTLTLSQNDSGYQTESLQIVEGENKYDIKVVAEDEKSQMTYSVVITKEPAKSGGNDGGGSNNGGGNSTPILGGGGGSISTGSPSNNVSSTIQAGSSASVNLDQEAVLDVPAGALGKAAIIKIEKKIVDSTPYITDREKLVSEIYEFTKDFSGNFEQPVRLTLKFDSNKIGEDQIPAIFYYDEFNKTWVKIGGEVNGDKISVDVDHFTKFAVLALSKENSESVDLRFDDIAGHWAENTIDQAISKGIVSGYSDNTFRPDLTISRVEFTQMIVNALQIANEEESLTFGDRDQIPDWAKEAVSGALKAGIVDGYEDGTFRPDGKITRAEMASMIIRALKEDTVADASTTFADDAVIPEWAKKFIATAANKGIIDGRENNYFAPQDHATRAEAITMIIRALEIEEE